VAESLLNQDAHGPDREKSYRAQMWLRELQGDTPGIANQQMPPRRRMTPGSPSTLPPTANSTTIPAPAPSTRTADGRPTLARTDSSLPPPAPAPAAVAPAPEASPTAPPPPPSLYRGATSGTLECKGGPIPQNAEYVFRDLPSGTLQLDYDTRIWEARLSPGSGQTQKLVLRNISSGPQKRCVVHWSVGP
jgi:hypothetical protein